MKYYSLLLCLLKEGDEGRLCEAEGIIDNAEQERMTTITSTTTTRVAVTNIGSLKRKMMYIMSLLNSNHMSIS